MEDALRNCYDATDWDVLLSAHGEDIEWLTHCLTDYLNFCVLYGFTLVIKNW